MAKNDGRKFKKSISGMMKVQVISWTLMKGRRISS